tara:strand:- start:11703 stop:12776 length:1074 start_codon:yes stop_codon:yes gene_type:complete
MARKRMIKPEFWTDEKIIELPLPARLLFIGLLNFSDDEGKFKYSPKAIKGQIFPTDSKPTAKDIKEYIYLMVQIKIVELGYDQNGNIILKFKNWHEHQKINHPTPSTIVFTKLSGEDSVRATLGLSEDSVNTKLGLSEDSVRTPSQYNIVKYSIDKDNIGSNSENLNISDSDSKVEPEVVKNTAPNDSIKQPKEPVTDHPDEFDVFYEQYPRKQGKVKALNAFKKLKKGDRTDLMAKIVVWVKHWKENSVDRQYIPLPASFINGRRWEDEMIVSDSNGNGTVFKSELDREIYNRNANIIEQSKRASRYIDEQKAKASKYVPDLLGDYKKHKNGNKEEPKHTTTEGIRENQTQTNTNE